MFGFCQVPEALISCLFHTYFTGGIIFCSLPACFKSEINVEDKHSVIRPVKIDLFSNGDNLLTILEAKFDLEPNSYCVRFKKKLVIDVQLIIFSQS